MLQYGKFLKVKSLSSKIMNISIYIFLSPETFQKLIINQVRENLYSYMLTNSYCFILFIFCQFGGWNSNLVFICLYFQKSKMCGEIVQKDHIEVFCKSKWLARNHVQNIIFCFERNKPAQILSGLLEGEMWVWESYIT